MSLTRLAVRIAAVHALRDATLAEGRVSDSSTTPIDAALREQPLPFLMVTTDTHDRDITGMDLTHGEDRLDLVIEAAIATRVTVQMPDGSESDEITIPNTDAGLEITLDLIEAQIARALVSRRSVWSRAFCGLVPRILRRQSRRAASAEEGLRFAARQIILTCDPLADPVPGAPLPEGQAWDTFLKAVEADPEIAPLAPVLRLHIEGEEDHDWRRNAEMLGVSLEGLHGIHIAPVGRQTDGTPTILTEIIADGGPGSTSVIKE